jgi:glycosidase
VWTDEAHTSYAGFAGSEDMPRFNHYNPEVVEYLTGVALTWMDLDDDGDYTDGIDGFRIDNATFPPIEFFESFRR